jgi:hypothetical protein
MTPSFAPSASRVRVQILVPERRAITLAERLKETVGAARGPDVNGLMLVTGGVAADELRELATRLDPEWPTLLRIDAAA